MKKRLAFTFFASVFRIGRIRYSIWTCQSRNRHPESGDRMAENSQ